MKKNPRNRVAAGCLCAGIVFSVVMTLAVLMKAPAQAHTVGIFDPVPLTSTEIRWRALFFLATMLVGVIWTGLAEHEPTAGRLPVFLGAMLIIGGLSGLIVSLVQSVTRRS